MPEGQSTLSNINQFYVNYVYYSEIRLHHYCVSATKCTNMYMQTIVGSTDQFSMLADHKFVNECLLVMGNVVSVTNYPFEAFSLSPRTVAQPTLKISQHK